jgi:hypothetical protein
MSIMEPPVAAPRRSVTEQPLGDANHSAGALEQADMSAGGRGVGPRRHLRGSSVTTVVAVVHLVALRIGRLVVRAVAGGT